MLYTIQNESLCLEVSSLGAQMMGLRSQDGTEYLWQGDKTYWGDRAPVLFPFIARLTEDSYRLHGKVYSMGIHGFAAGSEFQAVITEPDRLVLELTENPATLEQYPFAFSFRITYALRGAEVSVSYQVENRSGETMPFGVGGHPGFHVPLVEGEAFEDYRLEFSETCYPDRVGFTPQVYLSGKDEAYPLEEGRYLNLRHDLFDADAIILKNMARKVTLRSRKSGRGVSLAYPRMPYLGIWHWPHTDAPYVCIEPWSSLPSRQDVVEELSCKSDLIQLEPGNTYTTTWSITVF